MASACQTPDLSTGLPVTECPFCRLPLLYAPLLGTLSFTARQRKRWYTSPGLPSAGWPQTIP